MASYLMVQSDSSGCCQNFGDSNEIVGDGGQHEEPLDQATAAMPRFAQTADGLDPAEQLFDALALDVADAIARMASCACIDCRAAFSVVLRHMRGAAAFTAAGNEVGGVIVLVTTDGAARLGIVLDHVERRRALGGTVGLGQARVDDEAVAVLDHQVAHMAKLGLLAGALAEQAGVRVGGGEMRVILALLPMEVALSIAPATWRRRRPDTVLRYKALHAGPRFDQRPIDGEMLAGEQFSHLRQIEHTRKELGGDIPVEQPIPVLAKYRRIPDRLVRRKPD